MKNKWKFIISLGLLLCFNSCNEEVDNKMIEQDLSPFSVYEAQAKYETRGHEELNLKSGNTQDAGIRIKPDWCNAITSQNELMEVVETDLFVQGSFGFADEASSVDWEKTKNPKMITSLSRLVTLRYKKDGRIEQFLMTIMGDKDFHDKGIGKLSNNLYLSKDTQFSGYIFYHDLNGNFVNGWKYVYGKVVRKCSQDGHKTPLIHLKKADCIAVTVTLYNQFCTDWYQNGIYLYSTCENRVYEYQDYYLYCSFEPDPDGGDGGYGGGGGTGGDPEPASVPVVEASDLLSNPKAACIYQKLMNGGILSGFISRYFGITAPNQSYLGELNLTWKLGGTSNAGETIPIGVSNNNGYYSVEIRINETTLASKASTLIALTMLHEALHAKLIAEYYDSVGSTDFKLLFSYYKGWGAGNVDTNQETEMLNLYSNEMASALQTFDQSRGISHPLSFYIEAVKYSLSSDIFYQGFYQNGQDEFSIIQSSSVDCK